MTDALTHRGPDDHGYSFNGVSLNRHWRDELPASIEEIGVAMGHRRLSILDLSIAGRQPFASDDGRYTIAYNGEIYNYRELREELKAKGHKFRSGTDTEVVLHAYMQWGEACFNRLNGMWAFLIWDADQRKLFACRDRFGIKPLYFHYVEGAILFASEVKAILTHPDAKPEADKASVTAYLARRAAPAGSKSFFASVSAVEPGCWVAFDAQGKSSRGRYWTLPEEQWDPDRSFKEAAEELKLLLTDSVRLRLRSDVRAGTMLSGGLDSTTVIALVASLMGNSADARDVVGDTLHSFTASFPGESNDESKNVDALCAQLPLTKHTVLPMDAQNVVDLLHGTTYFMEMPWFNSVPLVHAMLMKRARSEGVGVVLNGHGADEIYAGYPHDYCPLTVADALAGFRFRRAAVEYKHIRANHGIGPDSVINSMKGRLIRKLRYRANAPEKWSSEPLVHPELVEQYPSAPLRLGHPRSGLQHLLRTHFFEHMLPGWLHLEDRISMTYSIEARLPFMDYRLIEFGFGLPDHFRILQGQTKAVLRQAMDSTLPRAILDDSRKQPFSGPNANWLNGQLQELTDTILGDTDPRISEFVDPTGMRDLLKKFRAGEAPALRLWPFLSTEVWLRAYFGEQIQVASLG